MKRKFSTRIIAFIILTVSYKNYFCSAPSGIDSILVAVQRHDANDEVALAAISIPYDKVVNNLSKCIYIYRTLYDENALINNKQKRAELIEKLALVTYLKGNGEESFLLHKKSIALFAEVKDYRQKANALAAMGYESKRRNLNLAMDIMREAVSILEGINSKADLASAIDNFGVLFEMKGDLDSATYYYSKALELKKENKDSVGIPYSLNNLAGVCFMKNKVNDGLAYISQSNEIRKQLKDYIGICWNEFSLGELFINLKDYKSAEAHVRRSLQLSKEYTYPELIARNTRHLALVFEHKKQYDSAYIAFTRFYSLNDSLYNVQKQNQLVEMETVYETEKKSFRIKSLNDENNLKEAELQKKKNAVYFLGIIVGLFAIGGILIVRAYRQKNKANKIILLQKKEAERQKEIIQDKQNEILDSIHYAKRIQQSLMPTGKYIMKNITRLKSSGTHPDKQINIK